MNSNDVEDNAPAREVDSHAAAAWAEVEREAAAAGEGFGRAVAEHIGGFMDAERIDVQLPDPDEAVAWLSDAVPGVRILREIGRGGMGVVYEGVEAATGRRVAVKLLHADRKTPTLIRRLKREAQALGRIVHPGIAQLYNAGICGAPLAGSPYLVTELVSGTDPLTYAERHGLTIRDRAALAQRIVDAVGAAHAMGVLHLDLKPGNIVVRDDGSVKLLDFGIARVLDESSGASTLTLVTHPFGTPGAMAPEQLDGRAASPASDVYALGVLLYRLLTGQAPVDVEGVSLSEAARRLAMHGVPPPRQKNAAVPRDLDVITQVATAREPRDRYPTARALSEDLQRFLSGRPIAMRSIGPLGQLRRVVARHPRLSAGIAAVIVSLASLSAAAAIFAIDARAAAARALAAEADADARARELKEVVAFQSGLFTGMNAAEFGVGLRSTLLEIVEGNLKQRNLSDSEVKAAVASLGESLEHVNFTDLAITSLQSRMFDPAIQAVDDQFGTRPLIRAQLLQSLAVSLREMGLLEGALAPQQRALAIREETTGRGSAETFESVVEYGLLLSRLGMSSEAYEQAARSVQLGLDLFGPDSPQTLMAQHRAASALIDGARWSEAEDYLSAAYEGRRRLLGEEAQDTFASLADIGLVLLLTSRYAEAEVILRQVLEGRRRHGLTSQHDHFLVLNSLGILMMYTGKWTEAEEYLRAALEGLRRTVGDFHADTLLTTHNLGTLYRRQGRFDEAERYLTETLRGYRPILRPNNYRIINTMNSLAVTYHQMGRLEGAEEMYRKSLEVHIALVGPEGQPTLRVRINLARLVLEMGRLEAAEEMLRDVLEACERVLGPDHRYTATALVTLSGLRQREGRLEEAEALARDALDRLIALLGPDSATAIHAARQLVSILGDAGRLEEALTLSSESIEHNRASGRGADNLAGRVLLEHGRVLAALDRFDDAEDAMLSAHAVFLDSSGPVHLQTREAADELVSLYELRHTADPEAGHGSRAAEWRQRLNEAKDPSEEPR